MVKRGSKPQGTGSAVEQLQAALTRSLKENVEMTVSSVCKSFQQAVSTQTARETTDGSGDYYDSCRRLVEYIEKNMQVSPGFTEQMDRIILACHSGASERVLNSVVTEKVWFHRHGGTQAMSSLDKKKQTKQSSLKSSKRGGGSSSSRLANKKKKKASKLSVSSAPATESTSIRTRSASGKKRNAKDSVDDAYSSKRPRAARKAIVYDTSDEEDEIKEEKEIKLEDGHQERNHTGEEKRDKVPPNKDAIGEMCYPDQRTPKQTKLFKDQLRKSIQFVDALLCKPPPGKVCGRACKKIRAQMCSSSTPCKNKMCRIWHDVETHTDHCLNSQCEFKNRILLRETMHKLELKEQQIAATKAELDAKRAEVNTATENDKNALKEEISVLEIQLIDHTSEIDVLEETKKAFWGILNTIGIEVSDDVVDGFPDFGTHYVDKKEPRKARKAVTARASRSSSVSSSSLRPATRTAYASSHGSDDDYEEKLEDVGSDSTNETTQQRTRQRSSSSGRRNAQESISGNNDVTSEDKKMLHVDPSDSPQPMEPPLPLSGPPPIRQNPEIAREYTISASGYSIYPAADDLESPAIVATSEVTQVVESFVATESTSEVTQVVESFVATESNEGQLADIQQASEEVSGIMASISSIPTPEMPPSTNLADPLLFEEHSTTNLSSIPPSMESFNATTSSSTPEPLNMTDGTIQDDQLQQNS